MPKKQKRVYHFKNLQGSSSSTPSNPAQDGSSGLSPSVNERLTELRKLESTKAARKKRELAETVNQRSVPPQLHAILGVPESAPPKPKRNVRIREWMRTPGPAPPKSWLRSAAGVEGSWTGKRWNSRNSGANSSHVRDRPRYLLRFARLSGVESWDSTERKGSTLTHLSLKKIAENWDLIEEDEYPALANIPLRLRLRLLSYIDYYGPALDCSGLEALLQGSENIQHLDLASLLGHHGLTFRKLIRQTHRPQAHRDAEDSQDVAESWDTEDVPEMASLRLSSTLQPNRLSQLTHLCLSHPNIAGANWRDLLAFTKQTPQLTHLSLAYWPRPTLTPNLATTTISASHSPGEIHAGGSHYYSELDEDLHEPAALLRKLSANILCLEWLDLEGCAEWAPALGVLAVQPHKSEETSSPPATDSDGWSSSPTPAPSIYVSTWSRLSEVRVSQGWLPTDLGFCTVDPMFTASLKSWKTIEGLPRVSASIAEHPSQDVTMSETRKARIWLIAEQKLAKLHGQINSVRRGNGYPTIRVVHDLPRKIEQLS